MQRGERHPTEPLRAPTHDVAVDESHRARAHDVVAVAVGDPERNRDRWLARPRGNFDAAKLRTRRKVIARGTAETKARHAEQQIRAALAVRAHERQIVARALVTVGADLTVVDDLLQLD